MDMLKDDKPKNDIPRPAMVNARIQFLKNRIKLEQNQINQHEEEIMRLEAQLPA